MTMSKHTHTPEIPRENLFVAKDTCIGASPPRWDIFAERKATVILGECLTPGGLEREILTDLTPEEIDKAKANAMLHMQLTHGQIDISRIKLSENRFILIDDHEITFKPLHVMVVLNSIDDSDPKNLAFCLALAKVFEHVAGLSGDSYLFREACNAVDKYKAKTKEKK